MMALFDIKKIVFVILAIYTPALFAPSAASLPYYCDRHTGELLILLGKEKRQVTPPGGAAGKRSDAWVNFSGNQDPADLAFPNPFLNTAFREFSEETGGAIDFKWDATSHDYINTKTGQHIPDTYPAASAAATHRNFLFPLTTFVPRQTIANIALKNPKLFNTAKNSAANAKKHVEKFDWAWVKAQNLIDHANAQRTLTQPPHNKKHPINGPMVATINPAAQLINVETGQVLQAPLLYFASSFVGRFQAQLRALAQQCALNRNPAIPPVIVPAKKSPVKPKPKPKPVPVKPKPKPAPVKPKPVPAKPIPKPKPKPPVKPAPVKPKPVKPAPKKPVKKPVKPTPAQIAVIKQKRTIALLNAAVKGNLAIVRQLLANPKLVNINAVNKQGLTPLMIAVINNKPNVVRLLVNKGANTKVKNKAGLTAAALAKQKLKGNPLTVMNKALQGK